MCPPAVRSLFTVFALSLLLLPAARADLQPIWQIGQDDDPLRSNYQPTDEFSSENYSNDKMPGKVTRLPSDPLYSTNNNPGADDDFYCAGTYPAGFNHLTNTLVVPNNEPDVAWERALTDTDKTNRVHFFLTGSEAGATSRLRLSLELVEGGWWFGSPINQSGEGFGPHDITIRFRNSAGQTTLLWTNRVDRDTRVILDFPATNVLASAGPNTIEIARLGPKMVNVSYWVNFDYLSLEANTNGLEDADGDGLPRWWEEDNYLSDNNPADAASDADHDGLTALQEFNGGNNPSNPNRADTDGDGLNDATERALGTNPNNADTDSDSISDGDEVNGSPASSPLSADGDGDGAPDSLERRVGTNPLNAASKPTVFRGAIGIHFVSQSDLDGTLGTNETAGIVPQTLWNDTVAMANWNRPSGSTADIATPLTNRIVRSDGAVLTNLTINWTSDNTDASGNRGSSDRKLMDGYIRAYDTTEASVTISNIPFAHYHLVVIFGASYNGQLGRVRLGNNPATDLYFETLTTSPQTQFVELRPDGPLVQAANFIRYTNLTAQTATVSVANMDGWSLGIHAIQIVDANLDSDASGLPDWWEMQQALEPGSTALASADTDGDGLSNSQEFARGSNPRVADTDGDGLLDGQESAYNALHADSDGDGVSDYDEVNGPRPTNPNLADSDGDGVSDLDERTLGTDGSYNPATSPTFVGWVPFYRSSPKSWEWNLENVQFVWSHNSDSLNWDGDTLASFSIRNPASGDWRSMGMELRFYQGSVTYLFHSQNTGAFSYPRQPNSSIWDSPYNSVPDLKSALGFSGYGTSDISDRLQFRLYAQRSSSNAWALTFEIRNQTKGTVAVSRTFTNCTAAASVDNGTAKWTDYDGVTNQPSMDTLAGVQMFISPTSLETLPTFAAIKDTDNDGMSDAWEDANSFDKNSAADATADADGDGLNNRDEFLIGTNPHLADTDGDQISDLVERTYGSNPLDPTSRPEFAGQSLPGGDDLNNDGLPDAWEVRYHAFGLSPNGDDDGDGYSNAQEALAGTDPFDANSVMFVSLTRQNNDAVVAWPFMSGKNQSLYTSTNLSSWSQFTGAPLLNGGMSSARFTNQLQTQSREFYSVATSDKDSDGDGVADWAEAVIGSDPLRANSTRAAMPIISTNGVVTGTVQGDYASFVEQMQGGLGTNTNAVTRLQAARFLQQTTFGVTSRDLDRVQQMGFAAWLDDQISNQPPTLHRPYIEKIIADLNGPHVDLSYLVNGDYVAGNNATTPFARGAIAGPDQLRQRVAFALSQILVVSRRNPDLEGKPLAVMDYYDIFVRNAFGNYYDILKQVAFHPVMGRYLSSVGNQKARPEINQFPDENFAREVMQLFTIGLWELNPDGSRKLDALDDPIQTYNTKDITELARVFTGFWFGGQDWGNGGWYDADSTVPMQMWAETHDFGRKTLLRGFVIPERAPTVENGERDVEDALRSLFEHPNTGPFVCRQLIQFLVTSNPSSNYVARVSAVFADNGSGRRGDLAAVVKAILLYEEARDARWFQGSPAYGRLKEPVHRAMAIARAGHLDRFNNLVWWTWGEFYDYALQEPTYAPSVFNFFRPSYQPPGLLTENGLVGPAFQITDSYSSISFPNELWDIAGNGLNLYSYYNFDPDYSELRALGTNADALVDEVNLLFCGGTMSAHTRDAILGAVTQVPANQTSTRVHLAVYLAAACPEGAVQR